MDHENRMDCLEGAASDMRKEDCEESDGAIASSRTAIRDKAPRLAVEDGWSDCDHENNHKQPGTGQGDHGHDSASQVQDVGCSKTQGCRSRDGRTPNGHPSHDEGCGSRSGDDARGRTGARTVSSAGWPRTQATVKAESSNAARSLNPENSTFAFNEASRVTSQAQCAAASRSCEEGQESSSTEVQGQKCSNKKKGLAVPGGVVGRDATAATNVRGQKPPFENTHVPRPVTSSPEGGTQAPETGIFGDVIIDVSISSPFLVEVQASGRSWSAYCSVALVVISVVSAGFFICMSFQVFSVVRVHDGPEEYRDLQNGTSEPMADQAHAASTSVVAMAADEEEVGMTGDGDVE